MYDVQGFRVADIIDGILHDKVPRLIETNANVSTAAAAIMQISPSKTGHIFRVQTRPVSGSAAINALSVNNTLGTFRFSNILLASCDPSKYELWWNFDTGITLFTVAQAITCFYGSNNLQTFSITANQANRLYSEVNPSRAAIPSLSVVNLNLWIVVIKRS